MKDPVSLKEVHEEWRWMLDQHISLVCFKEGSDEIIGMNLIGVVLKEEKDEVRNISGRAFQDLTRAMSIIYENFNVFQKYNVDEYMSAFGLSVSREYRGRAIGEHILRSRIPLGRAIGIEMTSTVFTSTASQILADRAGFRLDVEIT